MNNPLTALDGLTSTTDNLNSFTDQLAAYFLAGTIISVVLTVVLIIFWIDSWRHKRQMQRAILDIQTTLHEMNERQKPYTAPQQNEDSVRTVASSDT